MFIAVFKCTRQAETLKAIYHQNLWFVSSPDSSLWIKTADVFGSAFTIPWVCVLLLSLLDIYVCSCVCVQRAERPRSSAQRKRMKRMMATLSMRWDVDPADAGWSPSVQVFTQYVSVFLSDGRSIPGHRVVEVTAGTHGRVHEIRLHPASRPEPAGQSLRHVLMLCWIVRYVRQTLCLCSCGFAGSPNHSNICLPQLFYLTVEAYLGSSPKDARALAPQICSHFLDPDAVRTDVVHDFILICYLSYTSVGSTFTWHHRR